mgnify:FL=1
MSKAEFHQKSVGIRSLRRSFEQPEADFEMSACSMPSSPVHSGIRNLRTFLLATVLILALGAAAAASASADGTIVAIKGGDRNLNDDTVTGNDNYALPLSGITFEYTTDNTLPQTGWTDFTNQSGVNGQASTTVPAGTYYVREKTVGANFTNFGPVQELFFDPNSGSPTSAEPYVARVVVEDGETTWAYPHTNNSGNPNNWTPTRSSVV